MERMTDALITPADLYISFDVEADGKVPGPSSMLSVGMCVCGRRDRERGFVPVDPDLYTFYRELRPISDQFDPEALAVSGLDRDLLLREGADPAQAMSDLAFWVSGMADHFAARPVALAYPIGFDWMFLHWYLSVYSTGNPFGHAGHLDIRSLWVGGTGSLLSDASKDRMPPDLIPERPHTHHALDDALEQAEFLQRMVQRLDQMRQAQ